MASVADFTLRFPEFCDVDDKRIQLFLDDAALLMTEPSRWLSFYEVAHVYHAAHLLTVGSFSEMGDAGVVAPVRKKEVDDVVIEKAINSQSPTSDNLLSTTYGVTYYKYLRIVTPRMVGV